MRFLSGALLIGNLAIAVITGCDPGRASPAPQPTPTPTSSVPTATDAGRDAGDCPGKPPEYLFGYCPDELPTELGLEPAPKATRGIPSSHLLGYSKRFYKRREEDLRAPFVIDDTGRTFWLVTNPACGKAAYWHTASLTPTRLEMVREWIRRAPESPMVWMEGVKDGTDLFLGATVLDASGKPSNLDLGYDGSRRGHRGGEAGDSLVRWLVAVIRWKGHSFPECNSRPRPPPKP